MKVIIAALLLLVNARAHASDLRGGTENKRQLQTVGQVTKLRLIDTMANSMPIIDPLVSGTVVNLAASATPNFAIEAITTGTVLSVRFAYNGNPNLRTENTAAWAMCGNNDIIFTKCTKLGLGSHNVTATPYSLANAGGTAGTPFQVSFTIVDPTAPTPTAPAPTAPTPTAPTAAVGQWIQTNPNAPIDARHEASFILLDHPIIGRRAYLIGGRGSKDTDIYDPVNRTWSKGAKPPLELHHMQPVAVQGKIWIMAAWTGSFPQEKNVPYIYVYDPVANTWNFKKALPLARRRGSAAVVVSDDQTKIYVSHGNTGGHEQAKFATSLGYLDVYDIATDSWTALPDAPNPRDHTGGAMINGRICVGGGRRGGDIGWPGVAPTDCYNIATGRWKVEASIPQVRGGSSYGTSCDGKLIVAGGEGGGKAWDRVDVFDGTSWTTIDNLVIARHGSGLAVDCVCNQIYIASGSGAAGSSPELTSVETYFPGGADVPCSA